MDGEQPNSPMLAIRNTFGRFRRSQRSVTVPPDLKAKEQEDRLNVELLHSLTPLNDEGKDIVAEASLDLFLGCVKSVKEVNRVFFSTFEPTDIQKNLDMGSFPLDKLAVAFVCDAIWKDKDTYGFHETINMAAVDESLNEIYESLQWKKLGFQIYTMLYLDVVKDPSSSASFRDFITSDRKEWARELVRYVRDPAWIKDIKRKIVDGKLSKDEYDRDVNALFLKLHLLDPKSVMSAYHYLSQQPGLPPVSLQLATRNYFGGRLDIALIQSEVESAKGKHINPGHKDKKKLNYDIDVYYGVAVDEFIISEARNKGLWTGQRADNAVFPWSVYWSSYQAYSFTGRNTKES